MDTIINCIILFIFWTIFWSFWWVLISRKRDKEWIKSILFWRSKCDNCNRNLTALELIPIISFFVQWWKCKKCWSKLPHFYWIIEVISWLVFVATYLLYPYSDLLQLWFRIAINRWLTFLIIYDIQKYELHTPLRIFTTFIALLYWLFKNCLYSIIFCLLFLWIFLWIYFLAKLYVRIRYKTKWEWFWMWDVYLSATIWLLSIWIFVYNNIWINTFNIINLILIYIILSCLLWLIYTLIERSVSKRKDIKIPFLPAMIVGFWLLLIFWDVFLNILM